MKTIIIPPIKSQGIKTKLVPWINNLILRSDIDIQHANWIEPFLGTGIVAFNTPICGKRILGDTNPHIINFYKEVKDGTITPYKMRAYLEKANKLFLSSEENGYAYYRQVRESFNQYHSPYDFIVLSRSGFNGMMRFNKQGEWNVPFCKKANRFSPAYITKICNQLQKVQEEMLYHKWELYNEPFTETIQKAQVGDLIYCDPPYYGRYTDYYNGWEEKEEKALYDALKRTPAYFILSTWHHNEYRENKMIKQIWREYNIETRKHFYHNGGHIENRHAMVEALIFNFHLHAETKKKMEETTLFSLQV